MGRRPMKKRSGWWEGGLASAAPSESARADRGEVEVPDWAVNDIGEVLGGYHRLPGLNERQHRALLVEQGLELLVELATCGIVRCRAGLGAERLDVRGSAGKPAGAALIKRWYAMR